MKVKFFFTTFLGKLPFFVSFSILGYKNKLEKVKREAVEEGKIETKWNNKYLEAKKHILFYSLSIRESYGFGVNYLRFLKGDAWKGKHFTIFITTENLNETQIHISMDSWNEGNCDYEEFLLILN